MRYFRFRVLFVHLLPSISLVSLNILLCSALSRADKRRSRLTSRRKRIRNSTSSSRGENGTVKAFSLKKRGRFAWSAQDAIAKQYPLLVAAWSTRAVSREMPGAQPWCWLWSLLSSLPLRFLSWSSLPSTPSPTGAAICHSCLWFMFLIVSDSASWITMLQKILFWSSMLWFAFLTLLTLPSTVECPGSSGNIRQHY